MSDFCEIWNLREKLKNDNLFQDYPSEVEPEVIEQKIKTLAARNYNWKPPHLNFNLPINTDAYQYLHNQTPYSRMRWIQNFLLDISEPQTLGESYAILAELYNYLEIPCISEATVLNQITTYNQYSSLEYFLDEHAQEKSFPFIWNFLTKDSAEVAAWCTTHNYKFIMLNQNYDSSGNCLSRVISISKREN